VTITAPRCSSPTAETKPERTRSVFFCSVALAITETDLVRNGVLFLKQIPGKRKLCDVNILKGAVFVAERQLSQLFLVGFHWA
jgi:hypothetical protein